MKGEKQFEVDYMGTLLESEIESPGSGFNKFQKEAMETLDLNEEIEFASSDMTFNVKRIK